MSEGFLWPSPDCRFFCTQRIQIKDVTSELQRPRVFGVDVLSQTLGINASHRVVRLCEHAQRHCQGRHSVTLEEGGADLAASPERREKTPSFSRRAQRARPGDHRAGVDFELM